MTFFRPSPLGGRSQEDRRSGSDGSKSICPSSVVVILCKKQNQRSVKRSSSRRGGFENSNVFFDVFRGTDEGGDETRHPKVDRFMD